MNVCMHAHASVPVHGLDALVTYNIATIISESTFSLRPANLLVHIIKNEEMVGLLDIPNDAGFFHGFHSQTAGVCVRWEEQAQVR